MARQAKPRALKRVKPIVVSPIPARTVTGMPRATSAKRVNRVRLNWFVVGSIFGVAVSFFMNFLVTAVIVPEYEQVIARRGGEVAIAEGNFVKTPILAKSVSDSKQSITLAVLQPEVEIFPKELTLE